MTGERKVVAGTVAMFSAAGVAVAVESGTGHEYVFTFNKIRNYGGETPAELGLRAGSPVRLFVRGDQVDVVELRTREAA